jgi:hypothetical protein
MVPDELARPAAWAFGFRECRRNGRLSSLVHLLHQLIASLGVKIEGALIFFGVPVRNYPPDDAPVNHHFPLAAASQRMIFIVRISPDGKSAI